MPAPAKARPPVPPPGGPAGPTTSEPAPPRSIDRQEGRRSRAAPPERPCQLASVMSIGRRLRAPVEELGVLQLEEHVERRVVTAPFIAELASIAGATNAA